jgi:phage repressor protein C with HTH and peptisase S24 domain
MNWRGTHWTRSCTLRSYSSITRDEEDSEVDVRNEPPAEPVLFDPEVQAPHLEKVEEEAVKVEGEGTAGNFEKEEFRHQEEQKPDTVAGQKMKTWRQFAIAPS